MKTGFLNILTLLYSTLLFGQTDWDKVEIKTQQVANHIYVLYGADGNIGVVVDEDYIYKIDDQFAQLTDKISAAIAKISDKPIQFVVKWNEAQSKAFINPNELVQSFEIVESFM